MNEEQHNNSTNEQGPADQMVKEATRRYKDIPKSEELKGFRFEKIFEGRIDKENYIYALVAGVVLGSVLSFIPVIGLLMCIPLAVIGLGVMARRFRDINQTGWLALIGLIPVLGLLAVIYLALADVVDAGNLYGTKPDPKRRFYHAILNM